MITVTIPFYKNGFSKTNIGAKNVKNGAENIENGAENIKNGVDKKVNNSRESIGNLIIREIEKNPYISRKELTNITGKGSTTIYRWLKKMQDSNIITRIGPDKGGHWKINKLNIYLLYCLCF